MIPNLIPREPRAARHSYDALARPFIDEAWEDVLACARHLTSLSSPLASPRPSDVAHQIRSSWLALWICEEESRMRERMKRADPYIEARLVGDELPAVSLVDILTTLDRIRTLLVALIDHHNRA